MAGWTRKASCKSEESLPRYGRVENTPFEGNLQGGTQTIPEEGAVVNRGSVGKGSLYNPNPKPKCSTNPNTYRDPHQTLAKTITLILHLAPTNF